MMWIAVAVGVLLGLALVYAVRRRRRVRPEARPPDGYAIALGHYEAGRQAEAETALRQVVRARPEFPDARFKLANTLAELGRLDEAEAMYRQALRLKPDFHQVHNNLGNLLRSKGLRDEAEACFRRGIDCQADFPEALMNLGILLAEDGRAKEAEDAFRRALRGNPDHVDVLYNLALLLGGGGRLDEAEAACRHALRLSPGSALAANVLGTLLVRQPERIAEAEAAYRQALAIQPDFPEALNNLGALCRLTGRWQEAEAAYRQALKVDPGHVVVLDNLAHLHLLQGHFEQGWAEMEYRWLTDRNREFRGFFQPRWDGKAFLGKTLLVHYEQGAGDGIQFFRYLPKVAAMGGRLVVECPASLYRLFRDNLPAEVRLVRCQEALPDFDLYCPLMSLPLAFQTRLETIPANVPYLKPPAEAVANCPLLTARPGAQVLVGVLWAGNPGHHNDRNRSLDFSLLEPLLATPGVTWAILQLERRPEGFERLAASSGWLDPMGGVKDFADTAAIIAQLDLVVGVDTSVIHLAGALGKPVWLLLPLMPDWRWLLGREDSPWYPGIRLFRQSEYNAWPEVVRRVACALPTERDALLHSKLGTT